MSRRATHRHKTQTRQECFTLRSKLAIIATAALAVFLIACGAGTGSSSSAGGAADGGAKPADKKAPAAVAAGQTLTLTEEILGSKTVVEITLANVKTGVKSGNQFMKADKGQFITADVTAVVKEGKYTINSASFKLVGADGTAYDSTVALNGKDLSGSDLTAGQKTAGQIVFDAAVGAEKGGKIAIKSYLAEGDAGYWTL
jgi:hypothetical protein